MMIVIRSAKGIKDYSGLIARLEKERRLEGLSPWLNEKLVEALATQTGATEEIATLRLHYEFSLDKKGDRRISATAGKFCRMLYKALVKEFST